MKTRTKEQAQPSTLPVIFHVEVNMSGDILKSSSRGVRSADYFHTLSPPSDSATALPQKASREQLTAHTLTGVPTTLQSGDLPAVKQSTEHPLVNAQTTPKSGDLPAVKQSTEHPFPDGVKQSTEHSLPDAQTTPQSGDLPAVKQSTEHPLPDGVKQSTEHSLPDAQTTPQSGDLPAVKQSTDHPLPDAQTTPQSEDLTGVKQSTEHPLPNVQTTPQSGDLPAVKQSTEHSLPDAQTTPQSGDLPDIEQLTEHPLPDIPATLKSSDQLKERRRKQSTKTIFDFPTMLQSSDYQFTSSMQSEVISGQLSTAMPMGEGSEQTMDHPLHYGVPVSLMSGDQSTTPIPPEARSEQLSTAVPQGTSNEQPPESTQSDISTILDSGNFDRVMKLLEGMTSEQLSKLSLPGKRTPLHYACQHGRVDIAQQLITDYKYSLESRDADGCTPLHIAAQFGQTEVIKHALIFHQEFSSKYNPEHKEQALCIHMFIDQHRDSRGNTLLHIACRHGHLDTVQFLMHDIEFLLAHTDTDNREHSVHQDCNCSESERELKSVINKEGMTLLHLTSKSGNVDLVKYLVDTHHCDPLSQDDNQAIPLHFAASNGRLEVVKLFTMTLQVDAQVKDKIQTNCHYMMQHLRVTSM